MTSLVSVSYFGPVSQYALFSGEKTVRVERQERYVRQTYRNRCRIQTSNGNMDLSVPVESPSAGSGRIKDIRVSSHTNWQNHHWKSLASAYSSSPFFEYYQDDLREIFEKEWKFLWDLDLKTMELMVSLFELDCDFSFTEQWEASPVSKNDYRDLIHPKKECIFDVQIPYYQVFGQKTGFQPEQSALDLLFNMGPEAVLVLDKQKNRRLTI